MKYLVISFSVCLDKFQKCISNNRSIVFAKSHDIVILVLMQVVVQSAFTGPLAGKPRGKPSRMLLSLHGHTVNAVFQSDVCSFLLQISQFIRTNT